MSRKNRVLILDENQEIENQFDNSYIISISKVDYDNLRLLRQYLPDLSKKEFSEKEKEVIQKYNSFIDTIKQKSKSSSNIVIDFGLKKILI